MRGEEVCIKLKENEKPFFCQHYPIPPKQVKATKDEVCHQFSIGVMRELFAKESKNHQWAFPGFVFPKKNGEVCLVIDFRKIHSQIVQSDYSLPIMEELLRSIFGLVCAPNLDMNMGYMSMPLDKYSRSIFTLIMPFGLFECLVLPQGISLTMDIYQGWISSLFTNMEPNDPKKYLDYILHMKCSRF